MNQSFWKLGSACAVLLWVTVGLTSLQAAKQHPATTGPQASLRTDSTQDYNQHLLNLARSSAFADDVGSTADYRIGAEDLLEISVYGAPDLDRTVRVPADGVISVPLAGDLDAKGL